MTYSLSWNWPVAKLWATHRSDLLDGVMVLRGWGIDAAHRLVTLTAVPYYSWVNREKGAMTIWIGEGSGRLLKQGGK